MPLQKIVLVLLLGLKVRSVLMLVPVPGLDKVLNSGLVLTSGSVLKSGLVLKSWLVSKSGLVVKSGIVLKSGPGYQKALEHGNSVPRPK